VQNTIYKVEWKEAAKNNLDDLPSEIALKIHDRVESHLARAPKHLGKTLVGQYKGLYRYRYGDYRVLYEINLDSKSIVIVRIGNRKEVY
jgi:mRNA interferase RelE/StbE